MLAGAFVWGWGDGHVSWGLCHLVGDSHVSWGLCHLLGDSHVSCTRGDYLISAGGGKLISAGGHSHVSYSRGVSVTSAEVNDHVLRLGDAGMCRVGGSSES